MTNRKTARGQMIDIESMMAKNDLTVATGNMGVNARGDKLGKGGNITQTRAEISKIDSKNETAKVARVVSTKQPLTKTETAATKKTPKADPILSVDEIAKEWVEDADGNFVEKDA